MTEIEPGTEVPLGMANPDWVAPSDTEPAPRLPTGQFIDPDDGTPVWYVIPFRGPDHEWTAGDLRALRGNQAPPPIAGPVKIPTDNEPVEFRPEPEEEPELEPLPDLDAPARNVTPDGVPHFLRLLPDGEEVCGGCTRPWPCGRADVALAVQRTDAPDGRPAQIQLGLDQLAVAKGVDVNDLERVVAEMRRAEIERTGVDPFAGITRAEDENRRYAG